MFLNAPALCKYSTETTVISTTVTYKSSVYKMLCVELKYLI